MCMINLLIGIEMSEQAWCAWPVLPCEVNRLLFSAVPVVIYPNPGL